MYITFPQARYFMRETGRTKTLVYEINDLAFIVTFFICRMGIGSFFLYSYLRHPTPLLIFRIGSIGLYIVSLIFMYSIARLAVRKYGKFFMRLVRAERKEGAKVTNGDAPKEVTEGQVKGVTEGQVTGVTEGQVTGVTEGQVKGVTEGRGNGHANNHEHTD